MARALRSVGTFYLSLAAMLPAAFDDIAASLAVVVDSF